MKFRKIRQMYTKLEKSSIKTKIIKLLIAFEKYGNAKNRINYSRKWNRTLQNRIINRHIQSIIHEMPVIDNQPLKTQTFRKCANSKRSAIRELSKTQFSQRSLIPKRSFAICHIVLHPKKRTRPPRYRNFFPIPENLFRPKREKRGNVATWTREFPSTRYVDTNFRRFRVYLCDVMWKSVWFRFQRDSALFGDPKKKFW